MRQLIVQRWCDYCASEKDQRVPSVAAYVIGIGGEDNGRPELRVIDACAKHDAPLSALSAFVIEHGTTPDTGKLTSARAAVKPRADTLPPSLRSYACPACGKVCRGGVSAAVNHLYSQHIGTPTPAPLTTCPDCGHESGSPGALGQHRRIEHQTSKWDDAMRVWRASRRKAS